MLGQLYAGKDARVLPAGCCFGSSDPERRRMPWEEGLSRYRNKEVARMGWKSLLMPGNSE